MHLISDRQHSCVACLGAIYSHDVTLLESGGEVTTISGRYLLNLTIATLLWEQGLDFPQCSLFYWFNIRPQLSAYFQSQSPTQHPPGLEACRRARSQGYPESRGRLVLQDSETPTNQFTEKL